MVEQSISFTEIWEHFRIWNTGTNELKAIFTFLLCAYPERGKGPSSILKRENESIHQTLLIEAVGQ